MLRCRRRSCFVRQTIQTDLLPGGSDIPVTAANRLSYCHLLADWMLNERLSRGSAAFAGEQAWGCTLGVWGRVLGWCMVWACCCCLLDAPKNSQGHALLLARGGCVRAAGLSSVLPASWLRMFSPSELNQLVSGGSEGGVDVADMAK